MTTSSTSDRGRALLMSTAAASFVLSAALVAGPALAANECGAVPVGGGTLTCPANTTFPSITYTGTTSDLTLVTPDTSKVTPGNITLSGTTANLTVTNAAAITSTAASATGGIGVANGSGVSTITNSAAVSTSAANTPGLYATSLGAGNVSVTSTGDVTTTGASTNGGVVGSNSNGVVAAATAGSTSVDVTNVSATGAGSWGVLAESTTGPVTVTVAPGGTVTANGNAIAMLTGPTSTETLNNNGTITAGAGAYSVITGTFSGGGAPATVNNNSGATLNGPISLNGGLPSGPGNVVNNAGTWNVSGNSTFGAIGTTNTVNNTGTIAAVTAPGATSPGTATFSNLSTLNNAGGAIDLSSGNSLDLGGAAFNGGNNSSLRLNANSASGVLTVGSTPNGSTNVVLVDVPGTHPAMNLSGATIVTGPAGTAGGPSNGSFAFTGGGSDLNAGFVDYRLVFNGAGASTPSSYALFGLPGQPVFEALNIPYALQDFWRHSAETFTRRAMSIRDSQVGEHPSRAPGWEFWAQPYGGVDYFRRPQSFSFGGFDFPGVGNHNDFIGLQVGADLMGSWGPMTEAYWGFTGGVQQQTTHFPGDDANDLYSVGGNVGLYGGGAWNGFYVNAVGKIDFDNMNTNFFTAGNFSPTNTYKAYGVRGELGYRWPWQGFFVEPSGRVNVIWTDSIDLNPSGAALHFNDDDPIIQAQFGGRVGTSVNFGKFLPGPVGQFNPFPGSMEAFVGAWYEDQYAGRNRMSFTTFGGVNGPTTIGLAQAETGTFIHMEYGLETADWYGGLKLFLMGTNDFEGDRVGGWNASAGVRWNF